MESDEIKGTVCHFYLQPETEFPAESIVCWAGKGRLDDGSVGFTVEDRMEDDELGWGDGEVVKKTQGVEYRVPADGCLD